MKLSQCFVILHATPSMAWEDVKKSYHRLAKRYHPDLNPRNSISENKFKELNGAFRMLETHYKTPKKNRRQSVFSLFRVRSRSSSNPADGSVHPAEIIEKDSRKNSSKPSHAVKPKKVGWSRWSEGLQTRFNRFERKIFLLDTRKNVRVAPQTAVQGGLIRVNNRKETFQVKIPSGDWKQMSIRVPDKGETSFFGNKRGDLVLNIQVIQPEQADAGRSRFFYDLPVAEEMINSSRVQTLNSVQGPIKFVLPRNTQDGQVFVLKYHSRTDRASSPDHVVKVQIVRKDYALK